MGRVIEREGEIWRGERIDRYKESYYLNTEILRSGGEKEKKQKKQKKQKNPNFLSYIRAARG